MGVYTRVSYTGVVPAAGATVKLLDTTVLSTFANFFQGTGIKRVRGSITNDQAGTLNLYKSANRGASWTLYKTAAHAIATENIVDEVVEPYADWKAEWVAGGAPLTVFDVALAMTDERATTT